MQERGLEGPLSALRELIARYEARADGEFQLVTERGLEHLGTVGVEAEVDLVLAEHRDELAKLVEIPDHFRVEVRGRADLEVDPPLGEALAQPGVLRGVDAVA